MFDFKAPALDEMAAEAVADTEELALAPVDEDDRPEEVDDRGLGSLDRDDRLKSSDIVLGELELDKAGMLLVIFYPFCVKKGFILYILNNKKSTRCV